HARRGWRGLLVAGVAFILPASLIVTAVAWGYVRYGALPQAEGLLYGVKPVVMAIVAQALWRLGRSALKSPALVAIGIVATIAVFAGVHELIALAAAGVLAALVPLVARTGRVALLAMATGIWTGRAGLAAAGTAFGTAVTAGSLWPLFLVFAKAGAVLFGSGYVLLAFLRADLVERLGWLTEQQLLDAVAIGQVTPGPVFTTATFIGYVLAGPTGALVAT